MKKRFFILLLAFALCAGTATLPALAEDPGQHFYTIEDGVLLYYRGEYGAFNAVIPDSVTEIKSSAFVYTSGLWTVTIPDTVKKIGESCFSSCTDLKEVKLPSGLKRIEASTFSNCGKLKTINLPSGLEYIGNDAFYNCSSYS